MNLKNDGKVNAMTDTIVRAVPVSEARPGDRVTVTWVIQRPVTATGFAMHGAGDLLRLAFRKGDYILNLDDASGVECRIERDVPTTNQEPPGLGAVVRTIRTADGTILPRTYVGVGARGGAMGQAKAWTLAGMNSAALPWADVLTYSDLGMVEVLAEGWVEP